MSGFKYRKSIGGGGQEVAELQIIAANSVVVQVGDLIRVNNAGFGSLVTAGDLILGVVTGVTDKNGIAIDPDTNTQDVYTMASDNQTVAQKKIKYIPALQEYLFFNDADDSLAQTNLFQYFALNDENDVDANTSSDATVNSVRLIELDPDGDGDASKGLFQIVESFFAQNGMGTVDTGGIEAA